jgi:pimeloyl-ACP methyl ester carboxylesterase
LNAGQFGRQCSTSPEAWVVFEANVREGLADLRVGDESARFVRHYPEQNPVLGDLLPTITTPTLIVAGRHDDLVPWSNNEYLGDVLPHSEIHPLDAGHYAWEQAARRVRRPGR